VWASGV